MGLDAKCHILKANGKLKEPICQFSISAATIAKAKTWFLATAKTLQGILFTERLPPTFCVELGGILNAYQVRLHRKFIVSLAPQFD